MTGEFWIAQTFNGLSYGALLFLLASGLSLIFGVMRIVNLAHGSYFMLGGYGGLSVVWRTGSFVGALVAAGVAVGLIGIGMERLFLRRLSGQTLGQVLMTIGFALIFQDLALLIWGGDPYTIPVPAPLQGVVRLGLSTFPTYRIFIVLVAIVIGILLWLALERTRAGAMIRAAVDDAEMARGVGINVPVISLAVFALGACLAAVGGVIGGAFLGVYPAPSGQRAIQGPGHHGVGLAPDDGARHGAGSPGPSRLPVALRPREPGRGASRRWALEPRARLRRVPAAAGARAEPGQQALGR